MLEGLGLVKGVVRLIDCRQYNISNTDNSISEGTPTSIKMFIFFIRSNQTFHILVALELNKNCVAILSRFHYIILRSGSKHEIGYI